MEELRRVNRALEQMSDIGLSGRALYSRWQWWVHPNRAGQYPGKCGKAGSAGAQMAGKDAGCQSDGGGDGERTA